MFNPIKKQSGQATPLNRLNSLKKENDGAKETSDNPPVAQKGGAAFSKALNAVRQEVDGAQANKSGKGIVFGEAINARKEKTANPFLKISPAMQSPPAPKVDEEEE